MGKLKALILERPGHPLDLAYYDYARERDSQPFAEPCQDETEPEPALGPPSEPGEGDMPF